MPRKGYGALSLPDSILKKLDEIVKNSNGYFVSKPELIRAMVRNWGRVKKSFGMPEVKE